MTAEFTYQAFITYNHSDQIVATWLHRALKRYRIPARLVAEQALQSNRFLPLFRDEDELAEAHQ